MRFSVNNNTECQARSPSIQGRRGHGALRPIPGPRWKVALAGVAFERQGGILG